MRNQDRQIAIHFPLMLSICLLGCGPMDTGEEGDRAIQVVLEETGYAPFG